MGISRVVQPSTVAPLFAGFDDTLVRSALEGYLGEVVADDARTAARITVGDFAFPAGNAASPDAAALAGHLPEGYGGDTLLMTSPSAAWRSVIEKAWGERAVPGERYALRKDIDRFDSKRLAVYAGTLPPGVRLVPIDGALYRRALQADWSRDFVSLFADESDFLARGLGIMALEGEEPVAGASSYAVFGGGIEIEVDTRADRRRQGLATACSAELMLACFRRGLRPCWDAANRASLALAEKLGYVFDRTYPIFEVALRS